MTYKNNLKVQGAIILKEIASTANPNAGELTVYAKTDDKLYKLDSLGNEVEVGASINSINDIGDVEITSLLAGQVLQYNGTTSKWENTNPASTSEVMPVGSIIAFYGTTIPNGWLLCDGSTFSAVTYPSLNTFLGSTTLPDLRGYFLRGLDSTGTVDPNGASRTLGDVQNDDFKSHNHDYRTSHTGLNNNMWHADESLTIATGYNADNPTIRTGVNAIKTSGGSETRPKNIAVNYIIKATTVPSQVAVGGLAYQGLWDSSSNTPIIADGVGTNGHYYKVSVAGTTSIDGINSWNVGDWIIFNGTTWDKIDNTETVSSVNGYVGNVVLNKADVNLGNVTDDAQLKRSANDFNTFTQKTTPINTDLLIIEDSEDGGNKKYITSSSLPISTATQTALDSKLNITSTIDGGIF